MTSNLSPTEQELATQIYRGHEFVMLAKTTLSFQKPRSAAAPPLCEPALTSLQCSVRRSSRRKLRRRQLKQEIPQAARNTLDCPWLQSWDQMALTAELLTRQIASSVGHGVARCMELTDGNAFPYRSRGPRIPDRFCTKYCCFRVTEVSCVHSLS